MLHLDTFLIVTFSFVPIYKGTFSEGKKRIKELDH